MLITLKTKVRNALKKVSLVIVLLKMCVVFGQETNPKKVIVIDPGHGGKDSGAIGINGLKEKDVVLHIARAIVELNESLNSPMDIYLTRYTDTFISLSDRTKLAKTLKAEVFISFHCNDSDSPDARGIEVYVANQQSKFSNEATWMAYELQAELSKKVGFESRGVKFANFQVIRETIEHFPSMLLEFGFLSNLDDHRFFKKSISSRVAAIVILKSLIKKKLNPLKINRF